MNKISVIVPIYNSEKYLKRCLDSIINQSYNMLEIILVDDGSTDNSLNICNKFLLQDKRIKLIRQNNRGVSSARNAGINKATGEYITFIDSDDIVAEDLIKLLCHTIIDNSGDVSICQIATFKHEIKVGDEVNVNNSLINLNKEDSLKKLLYQKGIDNGVSAKLYKKNLIATEKFHSDIAYGEDLEFNYNVLLKSEKIILNRQKLYYYRIHSLSAMNSNFNIKKIDSLNVIKNIVEDVRISNPNLEAAAITKLFLEAIFILSSLPNNMHKYYEIKIDCINIINKYSTGIILDSEARTKHRIYAIISKINPMIIVWLFQSKKRILI